MARNLRGEAFRGGHRWVWACLWAAISLGCGKSQTPPPEAPPAASQGAPGTVTVTLRAMDLEDRPLAGLIPIATREANAFNEPVVRGEPTKADGLGVLTISPAEHLFLRMWDPALKYFANNFYEMQPGDPRAADTMNVAMVPGASLEMTLPAANATVDILMIHPSEGPWWPARATADASGHVHFGAVPAGVFTVRIRAVPGGTAELTDVRLQPGGTADAGAVTLNPQSMP